MKKFITMILSIFITLTVCLSSVMPVYAADTARNTTSYSTTSIAYAVFNPDTGEMDFIRSEENHDNGKTGTAKSISGGTYNGTIYSGFEEEHYGYYPIRPILGCAPWLNIAKNVKTIKTIDPIKPDSISCWFYKMTNCTSMDLTNLDTSNVTSMNAIFKDCSSLISLDISNWDTSKVKDMSLMFDGCSSLKSLDVGSFDTSNTTKMEWMFNKCNSLISLDVSHFDTSNVTDMSHMFDGCSSLKSLNVGSFDTSNVTNMREMFSGCNNLSSLDLSSFDTSKVTSMNYMLYTLSSGTTKLNKMTFSNSFKVPASHSNLFATPMTTESGRTTTGTWGLASETASTAYTAEDLAQYGATSTGALAGTWYAQAVTHTITFDANGGSGTMDSQTVSGTEKIKANTFTRKGYKFTGWNTKADESGTAYTDTSNITPDSDMTLYAQWKFVPVIVKVPKAVKYEGMPTGDVDKNESYDIIVDSNNLYTVTVKGTASDLTSDSNTLSAAISSHASPLVFNSDGTKKDSLHISGTAKQGKYKGYIQYMISSVWKN